MKFKLDENLSPVLAELLSAAAHEAHSVVQQSLGGKPDEQIIDVCRREGRILARSTSILPTFERIRPFDIPASSSCACTARPTQ